MRSGIYILEGLSPVSWLITILACLPGGNEGFSRLEKFAHESVLKRVRIKRDDDDVMSKLISAARDPKVANKIDMTFLTCDAMVIIIAGGDTVSITLSFLFYSLARYPHYVNHLRRELEHTDITDYRRLQALPWINALINETLRLYPPVPTAPLRQTPPEGLRIGERFIPGNVVVSTPLWSLGRLESSYTRADEFLPERWFPGSESIKDRRGFAPFLLRA
ncbi:cytochrome P450 [Lophiotrema nucula]|uniref:Cytochrome P450 n=1 Tax=Lophiotrema nucula TaxID=690887 RepID=A0A6A5YXF2_9PLEO|nr:cytochrome P450 [Lophiotrema nucula]